MLGKSTRSSFLVCHMSLSMCVQLSDIVTSVTIHKYLMIFVCWPGTHRDLSAFTSKGWSQDHWMWDVHPLQLQQQVQVGRSAPAMLSPNSKGCLGLQWLCHDPKVILILARRWQREHLRACLIVPLRRESSQSLLGHTCLHVPKDPPGPQPKETDLNTLATQKAGMQKSLSELRLMAQRVKCLWHKNKEQSVAPQKPCKCQACVVAHL